jgi:predicted RNA-binding Zn-ribbon protein involved in translation (DUF1610 family)
VESTSPRQRGISNDGAPTKAAGGQVIADARERRTWRLRPPSLLPVDEVEFALSLDAAELTYGPYLFGFAKTTLPGDGTLLSLAPIGLVDEERGEVTSGVPLPENCSGDEMVLPAPGDLDEATREKLASRYLRVLGRALFDEIARAVDSARADVAASGSTRAEGAAWPCHEARVDIVCPECGETTSSSVYQARRSEELRCDSCGASINLRSEEVQRKLDLAEREWQAERERERQGG